jgi:hypothetical protein
MLRRVALVRTDVLEELSASLITVTKTGKLGTTLAVTSNRRMLRRNTTSVLKRATWRNIPEGAILHSHCREISNVTQILPNSGFAWRNWKKSRTRLVTTARVLNTAKNSAITPSRNLETKMACLCTVPETSFKYRLFNPAVCYWWRFRSHHSLRLKPSDYFCFLHRI